MKKNIVRALILIALLLAANGIFTPTTMLAKEDLINYPELSSDAQYYQTIFPSGLKYSPGWYGTFTYAPPVGEILLFDDTWTEEFGRCVFSMPIGSSPKNAQGGTTIEAITKSQADSILKSYSIDVAFKPWDDEILQVMRYDLHYIGAWSGEKLKQKWLFKKDNSSLEGLTDRQKQFIEDTKDVKVKEVDLEKYDPPRYWVGDGGLWADNANHWSAASGGAPGASLPTSADNVIFDANSFTVASQIVAFGASGVCAAMDWTGATDNPTLNIGGHYLDINGSATYIAAMTSVANTNRGPRFQGAGAYVLTTNGLTLQHRVMSYTTGSLTLGDDLTISSSSSTGMIMYSTGSFDTANFDVTMSLGKAILFDNDAPATNTFGSSTITCGSFIDSGTNTLAAGTSTIICTGSFTGNSKTYNIVNLTGATGTIAGSNTFAELNFDSAIAQAITFTDGTTQTVTDADWSGSAGNIHTLTGTGVAGWTCTKAGGGYIIADYLDLSYSTGAPVDTWSYWTHSTEGAGVVDWGVPFLFINVDGGEWEDYVGVAGVSVPDNAIDLISFYGASMPYVLHQKISVGGVQQQHIEWEYDTTFTDLSGNSNDATPSFITGSSDPFISATLSSFLPITEAKAPAYTLDDPPDFITTMPGMSGNFTTTNTINITAPGWPVIREVAIAGAVPERLLATILTCLGLLMLSFAMSYMFKKSNNNNILIKVTIIFAAMCVLTALRLLDMWQVYMFVVIALGIMWMSRQREVY